MQHFRKYMVSMFLFLLMVVSFPTYARGKETYHSSSSKDEYIDAEITKTKISFTGRVGLQTPKGCIRFIRLTKKGKSFTQSTKLIEKEFNIENHQLKTDIALNSSTYKLKDGFYDVEFYIPDNKCYSIYLKYSKKKLTFYEPSSYSTDKTAMKFVKFLNLSSRLERVYHNEFINSPSDMTATKAQREELEIFTKNLCKDSTTQYDMVKQIYYWVVENIYYNMQIKEGTNGNNNPYYVFQKRYAVCEGYARLLGEMLSIMNIENVYLTGVTHSGMPIVGGESSHAWLAICADGRWFYADPTWDSNNRYYKKSKLFKYQKSSRDFFDMTLRTISSTHRITALDAGMKKNGFGITFCDSLLTATSYQGNASSIRYPASFHGLTIRQANSTRILGDFKKRVKSIYIPKGYTCLGHYAFQYYVNLKKISISQKFKIGNLVLLSTQKNVKIIRRGE